MKLKATIYQLIISNSLFESIHGGKFPINEICIQTNHGTFFINKKFIGELTDFYRYENAKKVKDIEIDEEDVKIIKEIVIARKKLEGLTNELHDKYAQTFVIPIEEHCYKCDHTIPELTKEIKDKNSKKGRSMNSCLNCKDGFYSQRSILVK